MKPTGLCMNCMNGYMAGGVCTSCKSTGVKEEKRNPAALPLGAYIHDRYYIGRVLGAGGFGITYMAWDAQKQQRVALKELFPASCVRRKSGDFTIEIGAEQQESFEHLKKRFLDEARTLSKFFAEPEIISVYHLFADNNTAYYSMEYFEGEDLRTRIKREGTMKWDELSEIAASVMRQLEIVHKEDFIHRDISPDNIFLRNSCGARLIDFGSAREYGKSKQFTTFVKQSFAPVEQYRSDGVQGPWTDIYALSVSLYYALTGLLPPNAVERMRNDKLRPIENAAPKTPEYVCRAINRGMAVEPENRFANVREMQEALRLGSEPSDVYALRCVEGVLKGGIWYIKTGETIAAGRMNHCGIRYPLNTPGVSREQFTVTAAQNGRLAIRDDGSSFGTYVNNISIGRRQWVLLDTGSVISFAKESFTAEKLSNKDRHKN